MPSFKLKVEGAEGREAHLENDDLLPTTKENRSVLFEAGVIKLELRADDEEHGDFGHSPFSGSVPLELLRNGLEPTLS